jgi:hypothetical protein
VERPDGSLAFVPADGGGPTATARLQLARPWRIRGVSEAESVARALQACARWARPFEALKPMRPSLLHVCARAGPGEQRGLADDVASGVRANE